MEIHLSKHCVDKCPTKINNNEVFIDYSRRVCREKKENFLEDILNNI